jgi:tripartite-type tricarboxylate transporter receptor subunit TctC
MRTSTSNRSIGFFQGDLVTRAIAIAAFALGACGGIARAADSYPIRPVRLVVPLFAGAGTDIIARQVASALSQRLSQSVVVDNRPGASTTLGTQLVAQSTPDGYTLLVATTSTLSVLPNVMKPPYDTVKDLAPVAAFCVSPFIFVVSGESRIKSLADLVTSARANPGRITFGSSGTGTLTHMVVELFSVVARINLQHVPYKGVTGAYTDVLGGRIDLVADAPASTLPNIKAGRFRALAVTSPKRNALLPDVPSMAELGYAAAESDFVTGLLAPSGSPKPVVARLQNEVLRIAHSPEFKEFLAQQGYEALALTSDEFSARIRTELVKWSRVVRERNIKVE